MVAEALRCLVEVEVVAAVDVDVFGHGRAEVGDVVVVDLEAGGAELIDRRGEEAGVEGGDAVDHQGQAQGLGRWSASWRVSAAVPGSAAG